MTPRGRSMVTNPGDPIGAGGAIGGALLLGGAAILAGPLAPAIAIGMAGEAIRNPGRVIGTPRPPAMGGTLEFNEDPDDYCAQGAGRVDPTFEVPEYLKRDQARRKARLDQSRRR